MPGAASHRRRLARFAGLFLAALIPGALLFGAFAPASMIEHAAEGGIACVFLTLTGFPCPFCGMTRATLALGQGDFGAALVYHPLAPVVLVLTFGAAIYLARGKTPQLFGARVGPLAALGVIAAIWVVKLAV